MILSKCRPTAHALPNAIVPRLQLRLGLSDEQTDQVREIVERRHPRMIESRTLGAQAMLDEFDAMQREISAVLDENQKRTWRATADSVRRRFLPPERGR